MLTHMEMARIGLKDATEAALRNGDERTAIEALSKIPYRDTFICTGCGMSIALFNRDGELVALAVHRPYTYTHTTTYLGPGHSGFGMWSEKRARSCEWGK